MSIRYKIFGAFSVVILLACGLAFYGIRGISTAGDQVVRLYDGPLMGINHARSAHAGMNEARLIMQRSLTDGATSEAVARFEKLVRNIFEDLSVVRDRVQSANVKTAREKAEASLRGWSGAGLKILKPAPGGLTEIPTTFSLMQQGDEAAAALDDLVELVAAYGFDYRTEAEASVAEARTAMLGIAIGTAFVGFIIAIAFAYSLSKPISAAVRIAERVAAGNFADDIAVRRRDELGRLLKSLAVMQASLKARADQDLALMSSKDETHAQQVNRRQRIEAEIEAFRSTFTAALANTDRMTGELTTPRRRFPRSRTPPASNPSRRRPPPAKPRPTFRPWQPPPASSAIPCRRSRRRSMTPPRSCSAPPAWPGRPTTPFGRSPAPPSISTRS